ncbi:MAG: hypothetical protein HY744_17770 [Deltaproteobacteria bacterium]|nr:hypothetical protein [Deltaproteobacteria bacterium]
MARRPARGQRERNAWTTAAVAGGCLAVAVGCEAVAQPRPCRELATGGCPLDRGGSCQDPLCAALYACEEGQWRFVELCGAPPADAGSGEGGGAGNGEGAAGGGGCGPLGLGGHEDGTGCAPDLQLPDCPVAAAETCQPCATGCIDFFACTATGWEVVAYCDADGGLVVEP